MVMKGRVFRFNGVSRAYLASPSQRKFNDTLPIIVSPDNSFLPHFGINVNQEGLFDIRMAQNLCLEGTSIGMTLSLRLYKLVRSIDDIGSTSL